MTMVDQSGNGNGHTHKRPFYSLRALGRQELPDHFDLAGVTYAHHRTLKHDFYAATGLYTAGDDRKVILKVQRLVPFCGIPFAWLGRRLCARELRFYSALAGVDGIPRILGRVGPTGFVHEYVEGAPLSRERSVPDGFFNRLSALMTELHRRDMAYVDTNKPQNVLVGVDGLPYLIDFQISYDLRTLGDHFLGRWLLNVARREDQYHLLKHKRRMRPDELTEEERARSKRVSPAIRIHRFITRPYFIIRRAIFRRLRRSGRILPEGSK